MGSSDQAGVPLLSSRAAAAWALAGTLSGTAGTLPCRKTRHATRWGVADAVSAVRDAARTRLRRAASGMLSLLRPRGVRSRSNTFARACYFFRFEFRS